MADSTHESLATGISICKECGHLTVISNADDPADCLRYNLDLAEHMAVEHRDFQAVDALEAIVTDWVARMNAKRRPSATTSPC